MSPYRGGRLWPGLLEATGEAYGSFAEDYYETAIDGGAIAEIFALTPLTDELVHRLNPDLTVADLADDLAEIGYPSVGPRT